MVDSGEAFESLLASALRILEADGGSGLEQLLAAHPEHAARLRAELEALRAAGLAGTLAPSEAPSAADSAPVPQRIGPYRIVRRLGAGGMGEVFLAEQLEPLRRTVALKVVRAGIYSKDFIARFLVERQALSVMRHDGIARVFDAGATDDGRPWFAMEFLQGVAITRYCAERELPLAARLGLFGQVCDAVHHAHQQGVIHRDIKPGNVLVVEVDGVAAPKIIDFGLAKVLDVERTRTVLTEAGQILGTPEYMSPEQADPDASVIDTRTDVYALGVLLFELLTGTLPHVRANDSGSALLELLRRIREHDAPRPSTLAKIPAVPARAVRGDLDWIVLRALARERERRYASVSELAADVRRYLGSQPVLARPPGFAYVAHRFVRRHRAASAIVALATVSGAVLLARELSAARELAVRDQRFLKLSLVQQLHDLRRRANEELLPVAPGTRHDPRRLQAWLQRADALLARKGEASTDLERLAALARNGPDGPVFDQPQDAVLYKSLADLVRELEAFGREGDVRARVARHLPWCEAVEQATLHEPAAAWQQAIAEISDQAVCPAYGGLRIEPQLGLVPLRRAPDTGLWEFRWWSAQGEAPEFGSGGWVDNLSAADPVLVLLPGGTFWMGCQTKDPGSPNHDPHGVRGESPPHRVTLDPFFLGKHELTQGQWERWTGANPALYDFARRQRAQRTPLSIAGQAFPVEQVSWTTCDAELRSWGLLLPTEAQWEYGARAGTTSPWWTGDEAASLDHKVNLADRIAKDWGVPNNWFHEELDDGFALPARPDVLSANAFGLHCMAGNVWEWCRDPYRPYPADGAAGHAPGDGLLLADAIGATRCVRGGSFLSTILFVRSAMRLTKTPDTSQGELGVRVARPLVGRWSR